MPKRKKSDEPQFMDAAALLGQEILDDIANGKPITPEMAETATGKPSAAMEKEQAVMSGLIAATLKTSQTADGIEAMYRELIVDSHIANVTADDVGRYIDMLAREHYRGAQVLYITVSAIFTKVMHDLEIPISYDHIAIIKKKNKTMTYHIDEEMSATRVAASQSFYASQLAAAVCCYYIGFRDMNPELFEEIYAPAISQLNEEDRSFVDKFIMITLAMLTNMFSFLKLMDNTRLNEWIGVANLKENSNVESVLRAAAAFFGHKED